MNSAEISSFGTQFTASAVIVFLGHILERWIPAAANFPPVLKRTAYWVIALGSALGVHVYVSAGTLTITGLTVAHIMHGLGHWVQSVALQEFVHGSTNPGPPVIAKA